MVWANFYSFIHVLIASGVRAVPAFCERAKGVEGVKIAEVAEVAKVAEVAEVAEVAKGRAK